MEGNRTDEEQVEQLKKWWDENGRSIVGGIVIGLVAIFGWRGWQDHLMTQRQAASDLYEQMASNLNQTAETDAQKAAEQDAEALAQQLNQDYQSTAYATFSALLQARKAVENDDLDAAITHLQWALDNADSDEFRHLARLRLSRLLLDTGDKDAAMSMISNIDTGKFTSNYDELRGDILTQQGDEAAARDAYIQALANQNSIRGNQAVVQMKLDDLGSDQL